MLLCDSSNFASIDSGLLPPGFAWECLFFCAGEPLQFSVANKVLHQILWLIEGLSILRNKRDLFPPVTHIGGVLR